MASASATRPIETALNTFPFGKLIYRVKVCQFIFIALLLAWLTASAPCLAQSVNWVANDINNPGTAGSFTYNGAATPPTYTVKGAGYGLTIYNDSIGLTSVSTAGNVEISAQLQSQSSATTNAFAGLIIRDSLDANPTEFTIGQTVGTGITFTYKVRGLIYMTVVNGPAISAPVFLRLVRNGDTVSGYYSTDNETWNLVGSLTQSNLLPKLFKIGFVSYSTTSALNTAVFDYVTYATSVPPLCL